MSHVVREVPWGTIDIVVNEGRIFFQERWQYNWVVTPGEQDWTLAEKRSFHHAVDNQIWRFWSNRVRFSTVGSASFAKRFSNVPINFDVRWVLAKPHWKVTVRKLPAGSTPTTYISNVDRAHMEINSTAPTSPATTRRTRPVKRTNFLRFLTNSATRFRASTMSTWPGPQI